MKIGIVGGGITGLTAGYKLAKVGHRVIIFEKEDYLGGLASGLKRKNWRWNLERFFHHFFVSDQAAKKLISELGLAKKLFYLRPKTSIFKNGKISQFDSPLSILQFPYLSPIERLRVGLVTFYLKLKTPRRWEFEKTTAKNWLKKYYGQESYNVLWQPLLEAKFGLFANQVSMAWFWARIKKRSRRLGYLEGGFQVLIDKLAEKIKENEGKIFLKREIKNLNDLSSEFDRIIMTTPTPEFLRMKPLPADYRNKLKKFHFVGALNLTLVLKEKFLSDGTYWLNINEKGFPFVAVVEHTNFVEPKYYGGERILYVGGYYPVDHPYFRMTKKEIFEKFLPYLKKINPNFHQSSIINHQSSKSLCAQPVIPINYGKIMPKMKTPIPNLYLANQSLIYPWDRGVNYAIKLGERIAELI